MALPFQAIAEVRGAAVLPDDRVVDGSPGLPIPDDGRFTLVGDANRGDVARPQARAAERLRHHGYLRRPDFVGIVLDPAGLGKDLREFLLADGDDRGVVIEDDGA